jgi:hypothetical protein
MWRLVLFTVNGANFRAIPQADGLRGRLCELSASRRAPQGCAAVVDVSDMSRPQTQRWS